GRSQLYRLTSYTHSPLSDAVLVEPMSRIYRIAPRGAAAEGLWRTPAAHVRWVRSCRHFCRVPAILNTGSSSAASPAGDDFYLLSQATLSRISLDRHSARSNAS